MIKYKYLPFTHNKPRYQAVPTNKWQLKAQSQSDAVAVVPAATATIAGSAPSLSSSSPTVSKVVIVDTSEEDAVPLLQTSIAIV